MDALDLVLTGLVAVLSTALALVLLARLRDLRTLSAARVRISELERRSPDRELAPVRRFSRV